MESLLLLSTAMEDHAGKDKAVVVATRTVLTSVC
jgi:hypothetical protein